MKPPQKKSVGMAEFIGFLFSFEFAFCVSSYVVVGRQVLVGEKKM